MFKGLVPHDLKTLARGCKLLTSSKGTYLFHAGEPAQGFFVVHTGAVNVHRVTENGKEQVIRVFYPGESLGEVIIAGDRSYPASAVTIEDSKIIQIPTVFFRAQIQENPDLALRILASMSQHLRFLVETVEGLKLRQAESRVLQWLLRMVEQNAPRQTAEVTLTLPLAKHLLASQLGISSETLSRVFARLRRERLVTVDGRTVTISSVSDLKQFLHNFE